MKAVQFHEHGGPEVLRLEEIPPPEPGPGEVRLDLKAAGLNRLDLWVRAGSPALKLPLPHVPGSDGAGVVAEVGEGVKTLKPGDRALISPGMNCGACAACLAGRDNLCREYSVLGARHPGTYRESIVLPERNVLKAPDNLGFAELAAAPLVFLTAWHMLVGRAQLQPGEDVLVLAAGSGVGSAAIQVGKFFGCRVIATAGTDEKLAKAKEIGADETIHHGIMPIAKEVRRLTNGRGVDVVIEHVGTATWDESVKSLAPGGRLVTCGATTGYDAKIDLRFLFTRQLSLMGSYMGTKDELRTVLKLVAQGRLKPTVDKVFSLSDCIAAHNYLEKAKQFGKVVLRVE